MSINCNTCKKLLKYQKVFDKHILLCKKPFISILHKYHIKCSNCKKVYTYRKCYEKHKCKIALINNNEMDPIQEDSTVNGEQIFNFCDKLFEAKPPVFNPIINDLLKSDYLWTTELKKDLFLVILI